MSSASDRRSAILLLCVALAGVGVRWVVQRPGVAPGAIGYRPGSDARPGVDSVDARATRLGRPLGRDERIDVDGATAEDLLRLPRIGPALATRIVENRDQHGLFGTLAELGRVSGIGPSTLDALDRHTTFSGTPRRRATPLRVNVNTASIEDLAVLPGIGPVKAAAILEHRRRVGPFRRVEDLASVPGIGPKTLERLRSLLRVS